MQALLQLPGLGQGLKVADGTGPKGSGLGSEATSAEDFEAQLAELKTAFEEAGVTPETLSPELLAMLQQWLAGGSPLPEATATAKAGGEPLPLAALLQYLGTGKAGVASGSDGNGATAPAGSAAPAPLSAAIGELLAGVEQGAKFDKLLAQVKDGRDTVLPGLQPASAQPAGPTGDTGALGKALLSMPVPQRVGDSGWGAAIGERLVWMAKGEMQRAELKLTPPNLGPLEIRLTVNDDKASVAFVSHHAATRDAIEAALPRLREMLAQDALQLVRADVGGGQPDHREASAGAADHGNGGSAAGGGIGSDAESDEDLATTASSASSRGIGLLDLFA